MKNSIRQEDLSRRTFLGLAAAAGLTFTAAGCGGSSGSSSGAKNAIVTLWGDAKRAALYQSAMDLYQTHHSDTKLSLQYLDLTPYLERLATAAAAGNLADVLWMRDTHISRYGSSGTLLDMTPYLGKALDTSGIGEDAIATGKVNDGVFALPTHYVGQATLYDADYLAKKGVDYTADVKTWDDLATAATELTDKSAGMIGLCDPTVGSTQNHFEAWVRQSGAEVYNADTTKPGFEPVVFEGWLDYWDKLRKANVIPPPDVMAESGSAGWTNDLLVKSKAALRLSSSNHLTIVQGLRKTPVGMYSMPATKDASKGWNIFPPILISISAKTKAPDLAVDLVNFFINDLDAARLTRLSQGAPSSEKLREALLPDLKPQEKQFVQQISREMSVPHRPFPLRPKGAEAFNTAIIRTSETVAYGRASIKDAVATFMSDAERALSA
jgi:multiple sugar transport system substrate-binding protein